MGAMGFEIWDVGCEILDAGYWMLDSNLGDSS